MEEYLVEMSSIMGYINDPTYAQSAPVDFRHFPHDSRRELEQKERLKKLLSVERSMQYDVSLAICGL